MTPLKRSTPTITLESDAKAAAETAAADLASAESRLRTVEDAALAGTLTGSELARVRADYDLARLRADRAQEAAASELAALSAGTAIPDALTELLQDPELATGQILDAFAGLSAALDTIEAVTRARNNALTRWISRLRDLGVPDRGLTIDGEDVTIVTGAGTQHHVRVGGASVSSLVNVSSHIAHVVFPHINNSANRRTDPAELARLDRRGERTAPVATVRLLRPIGGHQEGDELSTRHHNPTNLARMVRDGNAELIGGDLPELPEEKLRTFLPAGSDTTPRYDTATAQAQAAYDQSTADRAVAAAFGAA